MTDSLDATTEATRKLAVLQLATDKFYYSELDMPVELLGAAYRASRAFLKGEDVAVEAEAWKVALLREINGSRFVSGYEIDQLETLLSSV